MIRWLKIAGLTLLALVVLAAALLLLADTGPGHRFVERQIEAQAPKSGLKIRIGSIEGSLYGNTIVKGLELADPKGVFLFVPEAALDWTPLDWFRADRLNIQRLAAPRALLVRLPTFNPGDGKGPKVPAFDIRLDHFSINRLEIAKGVAGPARTGTLKGSGTLTAGKVAALLDLDAQEGDIIRLKLDAEPDANRFDAAARVEGPAGGLVGALFGTQKSVAVDLTGKGSWAVWRGQMVAALGGKPLGTLTLTADDGLFGAEGTLQPAGHLTGLAARMAGASVAVKAVGTLKARVFDGSLSARSAALTVEGTGAVDIGNRSVSGATLLARLIQPSALSPDMRGENIQLTLGVDGPFNSAAYDYRLTANRLAIDKTVIDGLAADGQGRLTPAPVAVPVRASARRVTGISTDVDALLTNLRIAGLLFVTPRAINGKGLRVATDRATGTLALAVNLGNGHYKADLATVLNRYAIAGLGVADVKAALSFTPNTGVRGLRLTGRGRARMLRLDNDFLSGLAGGLPSLDTGLDLGPDGVLRLNGFRLSGPALALTGKGTRSRDGRFSITAQGTQSTYGPVTATLAGDIARPQVDLVLARPNKALGLANVKLRLDPNAAGFAWKSSGGSSAGPFIGRGNINLPAGGQAVIAIADLDFSGLHASGQLKPINGGLDGNIILSGAGVQGILQFDPLGRQQRIRANASARGAALSGPPIISATRLDFDGDILLDARGSTIDATVTGEGLRYGALRFGQVAGNVKLLNGVGELRGNVAGTGTNPYDLQAVAQVERDKVTLTALGTIDGKPARLNTPAVLSREGNGWRLAPVSLDYAGGAATLSGLFGESQTAVAGTVSKMPLATLDMASPGLRLGGVADGSFAFTLPASGHPDGQADLVIRSLTRTGMLLASRPIDLAVAATMRGGKAGARLVASAEGAPLGRAQLQVSNMATSGPLAERLRTAPLFAQLRYAGAADTLWRFVGVENFDLSGPVAIGADVRGTINAPDIQGSVKATNARIESAASGFVLTKVNATGMFDGARLNIASLTGQSGKDGRVTGNGIVDFAAATPGIDLTLDAYKAPLIDRDDIAATVTGPIRIKSDADGGTISGDVVLDKSAFRLGQASVAQVPKLNVRDVTPRAADELPVVLGKPWRLAFTAKAPDRLIVTGLGLDSEWQANLTISGTLDSPEIKGNASLIRGDYDFAGKRFDLSRGIIRFDGQSPPDPTLDIVANGEATGLQATIRVGGTGQRPEITFSSTPALPQDEVLSRLLFGTSITNLSAPEAIQLAAAISALRDGGTGLNPINELRRAVGLDRLRILPANTATGQGTAIAAGKYLGRRTYVEIISDGQGYSATRAEFQITRWLSVLSTISTIGTQSVKVRVSKDY